MQQDAPCCMGGHLTEPYEQKTQQSPGSGRSTSWHAAHSWNHWQALVGMVSDVATPHLGQVRTDSSLTRVAGINVIRCRLSAMDYPVPRCQGAVARAQVRGAVFRFGRRRREMTGLGHFRAPAWMNSWMPDAYSRTLKRASIQTRPKYATTVAPHATASAGQNAMPRLSSAGSTKNKGRDAKTSQKMP